MAVVLSPLAGAAWQFFTDTGAPLTGGLLYTYQAGTTTPYPTYTTASGSTAHTNPIVLDSAGRVPSGEVWVNETQSYKFILKTSTGVLIGSWDNINNYPFSDDLANTSDPTKGDALVGYRQSNASGNLPGAVGGTVHKKLQESVSVIDFGASPSASAAANTAAIQAAINYAGTVATQIANNSTFNLTQVHIPAGTYQVSGTILLNPGVMLVGDGAQSTVLQHAGGFVSCIQSGYYLVPNGLSNSNFSKWGGVKQLSIYGKPDPSYNYSTAIGRYGKTNQTVYGLELDGAYGSFIIEDVDIYYCQSGAWIDRSYFINGQRMRIFFSSGHGMQIYGSNLFKFIACDFQRNGDAGVFLDRQSVGTSEVTKASLFQSCDCESNINQGMYLTNYSVIEIDSCYLETNMLKREFDPTTVNQELYVGGTAGFNSSITITNTIFNAFVATGANIDVCYFEEAQRVNIIGSSGFCTNPQNSVFRFGEKVQTINWVGSVAYGNGAASGKNSNVIYDSGCRASANNMDNTLPFKNMILNGQLQSWQKATSASVTGGAFYPTADNWAVYDFDGGTINVSQQGFSDIQTEVPGYPQYYMQLQQTVASDAWGVYFRTVPSAFFTKNTTVSFGFWIKADSTRDIIVNLARTQSTGGNLNGASVRYTIGTAWQYVSYEESLYQDLTQDPQNANNNLTFTVDMAAGVATTGTFSIVNAQAEIGNFPTSIAKVTDAQNLSQCYEAIVSIPSNAIIFSGQVTSGQPYVVSVRFPTAMRFAPTVTILPGTETNMAGTVSVTNITNTGFKVAVSASGTGYGEWIVGYRAEAYY